MSGCPASVAAINRVKGVLKPAALAPHFGRRTWRREALSSPAAKNAPYRDYLAYTVSVAASMPAFFCVGGTSIIFRRVFCGLTSSRGARAPSQPPDGLGATSPGYHVNLRTPPLLAVCRESDSSYQMHSNPPLMPW